MTLHRNAKTCPESRKLLAGRVCVEGWSLRAARRGGGLSEPRAREWARIRNNPACEANVGALVATWRNAERPVVFVRHDSEELGSPLAPGTPGNAFKPEPTGEPDLLVAKQVNSAFHGTPDLAGWLRDQHLDGIAVCGITTDHCCETTARVGANLGFRVTFVLDATHTFDRTGPDGSVMTADELVRATATNLHEEFAIVASTGDLTG